jgi:hypothetical protein
MAFSSPERIADTKEASVEIPFNSALDNGYLILLKVRLGGLGGLLQLTTVVA